MAITFTGTEVQDYAAALPVEVQHLQRGERFERKSATHEVLAIHAPGALGVRTELPDGTVRIERIELDPRLVVTATGRRVHTR